MPYQKIYYTEVYLRNTLLGGKFHPSDLQREFFQIHL
jgi:hypothetical protein